MPNSANSVIPILTGLIDAQQMQRQHPATFSAPSEHELGVIVPGDYVKICRAGERFWCKILGARGKHLIGEVDTPLVNDGNSDINIAGLRVRFESRYIYQILKPPSAA